jgi:tRNA modification GTPase
LQGKKYLTVYNKCDKLKISERKKDGIYTSSKTGDGIDNLKNTIYNAIIGSNVISGGLVLTNARHLECLTRAKLALENAHKNLKSHTLDLIAIDLNEAYYCLGEITGNTSNETILDAIFSKFCLGK